MKNIHLYYRHFYALVCVLCCISITDKVFSQVTMNASAAKDLSRGFYYVKAVIQFKDTLLTQYKDSLNKASTVQDTIKWKSLLLSAASEDQKSLSNYFAANKDLLNDVKNYAVIDTSDHSTVTVKKVEGLKIITPSNELLTSMAHPVAAEIVTFLWAVLDPRTYYKLQYGQPSEEQMISSNVFSLDDNSFFSPLEVAHPVDFDMHAVSASAIDLHLEWSKRTKIIPSSVSNFTQLKFLFDGKHLSKNLDDSLHSIKADIDARLHWHGNGTFQLINAGIDLYANGTKKFQDYNYGGNISLGTLLKVMTDVEAMSLSFKGGFITTKTVQSTSSSTNGMFTGELEWHPKFRSLGFDIEAQGWKQATDDFAKYYYKCLCKILGNELIEPFIGYEQGYLPPLFVFDSQFNVGIRFKLDNSVVTN